MLRNPASRPGKLRILSATLAVAVLCSLAVAAATGANAEGKIPITTSSDEARTLYLQGRDLLEALRATDARKYYEQAIGKDQNFALAYVGLANTSGTTKQFVDAVTRAVALSAGVSEGERHLILGLEAGLKSDAAGQGEHYTQLVRAYPRDERARMLLGTYYFGRQDYATAVDHYVQATTINPAFSPTYNQLGYAYRFMDKYADAEGAFKKYIELIPGDPNPYDSYAELLMKMGRFDESIATYRKALSINPNFVASYVGIGNNQMFMDRLEDARATFGKLAKVARTTGERRTAHFWTAASYVQEGAHQQALEETRKAYALADSERDLATMSGDLNQMGDILREAGLLDEALAKYRESVDTMNKAAVPEEVKAATRRNALFEEGRLAVVRQDLKTAKARAAEYATEVAARNVPFELRQQHELNGLIALAEKRSAEAVAEFKQANQQDPRVIYLLAQALQATGDSQQARALAKQAASFNGLAFSQAYVRARARQMGTD